MGKPFSCVIFGLLVRKSKPPLPNLSFPPCSRKPMGPSPLPMLGGTPSPLPTVVCTNGTPPPPTSSALPSLTPCSANCPPMNPSRTPMPCSTWVTPSQQTTSRPLATLLALRLRHATWQNAASPPLISILTELDEAMTKLWREAPLPTSDWSTSLLARRHPRPSTSPLVSLWMCSMLPHVTNRKSTVSLCWLGPSMAPDRPATGRPRVPICRA
eukprot:Lithocolla_globosa_v1_NODE_1144_length_2839_cov_59.750449.p3 type:complete len:213 gc:universal NODE_1144_length_2839_cov_59.750449:1063-425(-)